jgi:hypothetical protein
VQTCSTLLGTEPTLRSVVDQWPAARRDALKAALATSTPAGASDDKKAN